MATALSTTIGHLKQLKQDFDNRHAHLPEQERHQLWLHVVSGLSSDASNAYQPSPPEQIPRTMSIPSDMTQQSVWNTSLGSVYSANCR
jgi:hypothetical protein